MWKEKLGSNATYQELINVFESAGYHTYANIVRCCIESEMDDFNDYTVHLSQRDPYPHPKLSLPSPELSTRKFSLYDEFVQINPAAAQDLPEGENNI